MKPTHTERENWRTQESSTEFWYSKLNDTEQFVIRFTIVVAVLFSVAYIVANIDVLEIVRVINDFAANVITEVISIAVTVLIIERLNQRRATNQQKEELILQMGSSDNGFAREAVRKLRHYSWLYDGSLQRASLTGANLQKADLVGANLQEANLGEANLQEADLSTANLHSARLRNANLQEADLWRLNLQRAYLRRANLQKASLRETNLQEADLWNAYLQKASLRNAHLRKASLSEADLRETDFRNAYLQEASLSRADLQKADLGEACMQKADLREANLKKAYLRGVDLQQAALGSARHIDETFFSTNTTLPNGDRWHDGYDLTIFTDPDHPNFWEPEWVKKQREQANN